MTEKKARRLLERIQSLEKFVKVSAIVGVVFLVIMFLAGMVLLVGAISDAIVLMGIAVAGIYGAGAILGLDFVVLLVGVAVVMHYRDKFCLWRVSSRDVLVAVLLLDKKDRCIHMFTDNFPETTVLPSSEYYCHFSVYSRGEIQLGSNPEGLESEVLVTCEFDFKDVDAFFRSITDPENAHPLITEKIRDRRYAEKLLSDWLDDLPVWSRDGFSREAEVMSAFEALLRHPVGQPLEQIFELMSYEIEVETSNYVSCSYDKYANSEPVEDGEEATSIADEPRDSVAVSE